MDIFTHEYNGVMYEFKVNRQSQVEIEKMQKEMASKNSSLLKYQTKAEKIKNSLKRYENELEELNKVEENEITKAKKDKIACEIEILNEEATNIAIETMPMLKDIEGTSTNEKVMFILLKCQKNLDGSKKYPELTTEYFERLADDIAETYGLEEYNEICGAIAEDVFTQKAQTVQPKSMFLKNRKK